MMREVIAGQTVVDWVAGRLEEDAFYNAKGIGLVQDGELIAGVVYNMYNGPNVCMHVAATGRKWLNKEYLYTCFAYPFIQLKCNRVTGLVRVDNNQSRKFVEHLGFKHEGVVRRATTDGTDMILYGMLKDECRWLEIYK